MILTMMPRGEVETAAQRKLIKWLSGDKSRSQTSLARELGISQAAVSQWIRGSSRPEPHFRIAIENLTEIPAVDWLTSQERRVAFAHRRTASDA